MTTPMKLREIPACCVSIAHGLSFDLSVSAQTCVAMRMLSSRRTVKERKFIGSTWKAAVVMVRPPLRFRRHEHASR